MGSGRAPRGGGELVERVGQALQLLVREVVDVDELLGHVGIALRLRDGLELVVVQRRQVEAAADLLVHLAHARREHRRL